MVTRHPFSRLVSGWNDKLTGVSQYWKHLVQNKILSEFRPAFNSTPKRVGATFSEFIQYFLKYGINDVHFNTQKLLCHPCQIKYDYIAKLESHEIDMAYIVNKKLSGYGDIKMNLHSTTGGSTAMTNVLPPFSNITLQQTKRVYDKFSFDMQLFGYSSVYTHGMLHAKCGGSDSQHNCC